VLGEEIVMDQLTSGVVNGSVSAEKLQEFLDNNRRAKQDEVGMTYQKLSALLDYAEMLRRNIKAAYGKGAQVVSNERELFIADCFTRLLANNERVAEICSTLVKL
jgi:hypothetical protein